jgi:S-adenosylmethionine-diacylgycerolhomoserine-N-methlytransferase
MTDQPLSHAALMDATYRYQRLFYDATRRFFLFGRDQLIDGLAPEEGADVLELACGTGRNLHRVAGRYPGRQLYGLDISEAMLRSARAKLGNRAQLVQGDACDFDPGKLFGVAQFDRIVLSFGLSMIPDWQRTIAKAAAHLAPGGELHIVDFGEQRRLPGWFRALLRGWIARFHVTPRANLRQVVEAEAARIGGTMRYREILGDYARLCILSRPFGV